MDFDELQTLFRGVAGEASKDGKTVYELPRAQLPAYPV
jgi:hypothetical protein